ncbi:MAG: PfkB family carbohydrate kinase [Lentimicrobiaceae bacterium]|nr:PfkB family carbohydrate kinase [Lentimicrobiaceae bacterium]
MRRIFALGETVLDILFRDDKPVSATPGGSMLNVAVSLGRLGLPVYLISEQAEDSTAAFISRFLQNSSVSQQFIHKIKGKTPIALAFLDSQNNAVYSFYHDNLPLKESTPASLPDIQQTDLLLFGSFYALKPQNRHIINHCTGNSKTGKPFVIYDPNFRTAHSNSLQEVFSVICQNIASADIVRASDEDLFNIFHETDTLKLAEIIAELGCKQLIITRNKQGVDIINPTLQKHYPVPEIKTMSTIGAGDAFNAGLAYALFTLNPQFHKIIPDEKFWDKAINIAINLSSAVCCSYENYIPFGHKL